MKVLHFPLTRITLGFVIGILYANYVPLPDFVYYFLLATSMRFWSITFLLKKNSRNTFLLWSMHLRTFIIRISTQIIHTHRYQKQLHTQYYNIEKPSPISLIIRETESNAFSDRYIAEINNR
jgi:competence protein ComEC